MLTLRSSFLGLAGLLLLSVPAYGQLPRYVPPGRQWQERQQWDRWERAEHERREQLERERRARLLDNRHNWVYEGGSFTDQGNGRWVEQNALVNISYQEVQRTPEFVEIFDPGRSLYVRLYANVYYQRLANQADWLEERPGGWQ